MRRSCQKLMHLLQKKLRRLQWTALTRLPCNKLMHLQRTRRRRLWWTAPTNRACKKTYCTCHGTNAVACYGRHPRTGHAKYFLHLPLNQRHLRTRHRVRRKDVKIKQMIQLSFCRANLCSTQPILKLSNRVRSFSRESIKGPVTFFANFSIPSLPY